MKKGDAPTPEVAKLPLEDSIIHDRIEVGTAKSKSSTATGRLGGVQFKKIPIAFNKDDYNDIQELAQKPISMARRTTGF